MFKRSFIIGAVICSFVTDSLCIRYKGEDIPFKVILRHLVNSFKGYNFDKIVEAESAEPRVIFGADGAIISITDGLSTPIYVSSIPTSVRHFNRLRTDANLEADALIGLYTLNTGDEQNDYGLPATILDDGLVLHHQYPTIDFTAPSIDDLARGVYDLSTRDLRQEEIACIHCKAGIGRSVTLAAAYLLYIYTLASKQYLDGSSVSDDFDDATIVAMIVEYIQTKRLVAHPNKEQRTAMQQFYATLRTASSLEDLCQQITQGDEATAESV